MRCLRMLSKHGLDPLPFGRAGRVAASGRIAVQLAFLIWTFNPCEILAEFQQSVGVLVRVIGVIHAEKIFMLVRTQGLTVLRSRARVEVEVLSTL